MIRALAVTGSLCFVAGLLLLAPERSISASVVIHATSARVWAVLADTTAYSAWAPGMRLTGNLTAGQIITNVEGEGTDQFVFHPVVLRAEPEHELRWFGRVWFPHLFDAEHSFTLRTTSDGTLVVQAEHFKGIALLLYDVQQLLPHFEAVNSALKRRAEQP